MKNFLFFAICLLFLVMSSAVADVRVEFQVTANNLPDSATVFITGNHALLGSWHPGKIPLNYSDSTGWRGCFLFPDGYPLEFKFTLGSWQTEALDSSGSTYQNFTGNAKRDTLMLITISSWKNELPGLISTISGDVRYFFEIDWKFSEPRNITVWLPPGYEESRQRYPVLYMLDGQNVFDEARSTFGNEWRMDEIADSLIRGGLIQPLIIVAVDNSDLRNKEYSHTPEGRRFQKFMTRDLRQMIDKNFRTRRHRRYRIVAGSSLGGLAAFILAWENPGIFGGAICMSPAFQIDEYDYVTPVISGHKPRRRLKFYIDNGGVDIETELQPGVDAMLSALIKWGFRENTSLFYRQNMLAEHNETAWSRRVPGALEIFFCTKHKGRSGIEANSIDIP